jgi:hypothetical protein
MELHHTPKDIGEVVKVIYLHDLRLEALGEDIATRTNLVLYFQGVLGNTYTIQCADVLAGVWTILASFDPLSASGTIWFTNRIPLGKETQFYRVLSVRQP